MNRSLKASKKQTSSVQNAHYSYILKAKFKKIFILKIQVNIFKLSSVERFHK